MKRTNSIKLRRIKYFFGNNIKKILSFPFAVIKLILSPLYIARAVFFPAKRSKYPRLDSDVYNKLNKINKQINDPLGGIKNIQDEHSRYIHKLSKNKISCLEDNMNMAIVKIKTLEDKKASNEYINSYLDVGGRLLNTEKRIKALEDKVSKLQLDTSDLTFLPADDDFEVTAKDNDFEVTTDDDCDKVFREEYDYHQEAKYWDKRDKEAHEDHMSEPKRRHDDE